MAGIVTLKCSLVKGGVEKLCLNQPIFLVSSPRVSSVSFLATC